MHPIDLSLTSKTLYTELRELALAMGATENIGDTPGTLVTKQLKGAPYLYFQYRDLDGVTRQVYLGRDGPELQPLVSRLQSRKSDRKEDLARLDELGRAFVAAGGYTIEHSVLRVLKGFADAGIFRPGGGYGVLVGTHAFNALGNVLGVRWSSHIMTQDIDIAGDYAVDIAISKPNVSAPDVLTQLDMGFIPVPTLDHGSPSTSFRVRGKDLRVVLLTPLIGKPGKTAIIVPALNAPAFPLRFLDYLIQDAAPHVLVGQKQQIICNLPLPERFALHKLLVSESRESAFATKAEKDRLQAIQMLESLLLNSPASLEVAAEEFVSRGKGWTDRAKKALKKCERTHAEVVTELNKLLLA